MVVCVSTAHVTTIHMLAISRNVTTLTFCCPSATHKKTVHANESKPNYEYDPRMWWSVTVRHSIRVYTALSKWNQIHRSLLLGVCLCTEQNMCHVIAPSRVLRSLEPLFVCIGWLREKAEKSIVNWTHTAAVPTTTITIDTYAWYRAHHGRQHLLWLMLTHNFFVECCTLKYILFGMQIVWRREESVKRRNIPFGKCVRHTTSSEQHPAKREKREKIARFYIFSLNC